MKRILFINPWIHDFSAYDFWMKPVGLLYLASILRRNGFHVDFIDCLDPYHSGLKSGTIRRFPSGHGKFPCEVIKKPEKLRFVKRRFRRYGLAPDIIKEDILAKRKPDAVFLTSMMTYWYPGVFESIRLVRQVMPDVPIVLGGLYSTLCTGHAENYSGADIVFPGNAERNLSGLIETLFGMDLQYLPHPEDLDSLPYPAFDLISNLVQVPVLTSRGCPFRCIYCASGVLNPVLHFRDPVKVVDEIEYWRNRFGVENFSFYDDALLFRPDEMIIPMLKEILGRGLNCSFHSPNGLHLAGLSQEIANLLFRAGFKTLRFGFETSDLPRQKYLGGKAFSQDLKHAVSVLRNAGYKRSEIGIYILCGLPGQSVSEVRESILFVRDCGARPILTEFSPIPGTPIWNECVNTSPYDISGEPLFHNNTVMPCRSSELTDAVFNDLKMTTRAD